jgi:glucokinase
VRTLPNALPGGAETVTQTARADAGKRAGSQAVTTEIPSGSFPTAEPRTTLAVLAIAAAGDIVALTNHPWTFSIDGLRRRHGFRTACGQ